MGSKRKTNELGFALIEGLVSLSILIILAVAIGTYVSSSWKRSLELERSSVSINAAQVIADSFKAQDNRTEPLQWQPGTSSVDLAPLTLKYLLRGPASGATKYSLIEDTDKDGTTQDYETYAAALYHDGAHELLVRYAGQEDVPRQYCFNNDSELGTQLKADVDSDNAIIARVQPMLQGARDPKYYLKIQRVPAKAEAPDCLGAYISGGGINGGNPLRIIPVGKSNINPNTAPEAWKPGSGLKITTTIQFTDTSGQERTMRSIATIKPAADITPAVFRVLDKDEGKDILDALKAGTTQPQFNAENTIAMLANTTAKSSLGKPVFCGAPSTSAIEFVAALNEPVGVFSCQLKYKSDETSALYTILNPEGPCDITQIYSTPTNKAITSSGIKINYPVGPLREGFYELTIKGFDAGQNITTATFEFGIDKSAPKLGRIKPSVTNQSLRAFAVDSNPVFGRYYSPFRPSFSAALDTQILNSLKSGSFANNDLYQCLSASTSLDMGMVVISASTPISRETLTGEFRQGTSKIAKIDPPIVPTPNPGASRPRVSLAIPQIPLSGKTTLDVTLTDECGGSDQKTKDWYADFNPPKAKILAPSSIVGINNGDTINVTMNPPETSPDLIAPFAFPNSNGTMRIATDMNHSIAPTGSGKYGRACIASVDACGRTDKKGFVFYIRGRLGDNCGEVPCEGSLICAQVGPKAGTCVGKQSCTGDASDPICPGQCLGCATTGAIGTCWGLDNNPVPFVSGHQATKITSFNLFACNEPTSLNVPAQLQASTCAPVCKSQADTCSTDSDCCSGLYCVDKNGGRSCEDCVPTGQPPRNADPNTCCEKTVDADGNCGNPGGGGTGGGPGPDPSPCDPDTDPLCDGGPPPETKGFNWVKCGYRLPWTSYQWETYTNRSEDNALTVCANELFARVLNDKTYPECKDHANEKADVNYSWETKSGEYGEDGGGTYPVCQMYAQSQINCTWQLFPDGTIKTTGKYTDSDEIHADILSQLNQLCQNQGASSQSEVRYDCDNGINGYAGKCNQINP